MKPLVPVLVALAVAPAAALATRALVAPPEASQVQPAAATRTGDVVGTRAPDADALARRLQRLEQEAARLELELAEGAGSKREELGAFEASIRAALAARGIRAPEPVAEPSAAENAEARTAFLARIDAIVAQQVGDPVAAASGWAELAEEGLVDEALEALAARSDEDPGDLDAALALAHGALGAMETLPYGPERVDHAARADAAFERALGVDPERDDVRFQRAEALATWPAFLGKRAEAIAQLETLVERGETAGGSQSRTYLLLGAMLLEHGEKERAVEIWRRGAGSFPDDEALAAALRANGAR